MNILIDMNLSPEWRLYFQKNGHNAVHWQDVGNPKASDHEIFEWAQRHLFIIFTHDLDFGAILAQTGLDCPSVIQIRTQDVTIPALRTLVLSALENFKSELETGALIVINQDKMRARILPLL